MAEFMGRSRFAPEPSNGNGTHGGPAEPGKGTAEANGNGHTNGTHGPAEPAKTAPPANDAAAANPYARVGVGLGGPELAADPMRDKLGRFLPDNQGGPGNPFGRKVARNRRLILAAFTDEEVMAFVRKQYEFAMNGNAAAAKLLMQYLVGKPLPAASPDRVNHEEWEMRSEQPTMDEFETQRQQLMPHRVALLTRRMFDEGKCLTMRDAILSEGAMNDAREAKQRERAERVARRKAERRRRKHGG